MMLSEHCMKPYGLNNTSDMERVFYYHLFRFRKISGGSYCINGESGTL